MLEAGTLVADAALALFATYLFVSDKHGYGGVENAVGGVCTWHRLRFAVALRSSDAACPLTRRVLLGCKRECHAVPRGKPRAPKQVLTASEWQRMLAAQPLAEPGGLVFRSAFLAVLYFGARGSNIVATRYASRHQVRMADLSFWYDGGGEPCKVRLRERSGKHNQYGQPRFATLQRVPPGTAGAAYCPVVALHSMWLHRLQAGAPAESMEPVFVFDDGNRLSAGALNKWMQAAAARVGVSTTGLTLHCLRYTVATTLQAAGVPEARVNQHVGWAPGSRAATLYNRAMTGAVDGLADIVANAADVDTAAVTGMF